MSWRHSFFAFFKKYILKHHFMAPFGLGHPKRVNVWTFFILYGTAIINNEHKLTAV